MFVRHDNLGMPPTGVTMSGIGWRSHTSVAWCALGSMTSAAVCHEKHSKCEEQLAQLFRVIFMSAGIQALYVSR